MIIFWILILASAMLAYVILDGFDLGVGILFLFSRDELQKRRLLATISPVWDGNETWLVVSGTVLFGAFPLVYANLLSAFYLPLLVMLIGLILRGVAFEYRYKATRSRPLWDFALWAGSLVAAFMQGITVGAMVDGVPMNGTHFSGGMFFWFRPFPLVCGIGLAVGYCLLGATWLLMKAHDSLKDWLYRILPAMIGLSVLFFLVAFAYTFRNHLQVLDAWSQTPPLLLFPMMGGLAALVLGYAVRVKAGTLPFPMAVLVFLSAFGVLAVSFWPYMIPFSVTIDQAAAPASSLAFMFWGAGLFVVPLTVIYTVTSYRAFHGPMLDSEPD